MTAAGTSPVDGPVRRVRPDDVAEVHAMIGELADYERSRAQVTSTAADLHLALFGDQPALFGHVVEHEGAVVGFALWFLNFSTWNGRHGIYLEDLYVRPSMRGRGLGKALLQELAQLCVTRGYARLEWWVLDWNSPAIDFYRSVGAVAMDEWTVHRLTGQALTDFGTSKISVLRKDSGATG
jgi:GNAT superfamily N-acetyltransferase